MTKKLIAIVALILGGITSAQVVSADSCATGNLQSYISLGAGGCTIDDKLFNNFSYTPPPTNPITIGPGITFIPQATTATQVTVTPVLTSLNPGLKFNASWTGVDTDFPLSFDIDFTVTDMLGSNIKDQSLVIEAGVFHLLPGPLVLPGSATVTDGSLMASVQNHFTPNPVTSMDLTASRSFTPVQTVTSHIVGANSRSFINSIQENFSEIATVPEPSTWVLLGSGLAGLVIWRRYIHA